MNNIFINRTAEFDPADIEKNRVFGGLSYLWILFLVPLFACPNSRFAKFHANQGLVLFIIETVINILFAAAIKIIGLIPVLGAIVALILSLVQGLIGLVLLVIVIYCLVKALTGNAVEIPLIGKLTIIK